jgi:hypothetical protein
MTQRASAGETEKTSIETPSANPPVMPIETIIDAINARRKKHLSEIRNAD